MSTARDIDDTPPVAFDPTGKKLFRVPPALTGDDPEFQRIREWCHAGRYVCAADNCQNRALTVVAISFHRDRNDHSHLIPHRAHFKHSGDKCHGAPTSGRASAGESIHHLAVKHHLQSIGETAGLRVELEVRISDEAEGIARRPDVVWYPTDGGKPWAFEVQFSDIQTWEWRQRTRDLRALGFRPFWVWGYESRTHLQVMSMADTHGWREKYEVPSDVWISRVEPDSGGEVDFDLVEIAQCFSDESFQWEKRRSLGARQAFPNALWADRQLKVECHERRGLFCPELEARLSSAIASATAADLAVGSSGSAGSTVGRLSPDAQPAITAEVVPGPKGVQRQSVMCRCGFPNFLPAIRRARVYNVDAGEWETIEEPQAGWPDHPCCHHWMTDLGYSTCRACEGSRSAERNRKARL